MTIPHAHFPLHSSNGFARSRQMAGVGGFALAIGLLVLSACGGSGGTAAPTTSVATAGGQVLPVTSNPIANPSTDQTLTIESVLVENNVDEAGAAAPDHLEIALSNTGTTDLGDIEVFYTFDDPTTGQSESYYAMLPASFTVPAGGSRNAHFDDSGAVDHFPVNQFSMYYSDTNALEVTVEVSAANAAPQSMTVEKDAGGPETAD